MTSYKKILALIVLCFLSSCAQKVSFNVIRPSRLPIRNVENIEIGKFIDETGKTIPAPKLEGVNNVAYIPLKPVVKEFKSNKNTANLVRGLVVSGLTLESQYHLLNTEEGVNLTEGIPDAGKTAILSAKIKYFENDGRGGERLAYVLIAKKGNLPPFEKFTLLATTSAFISKLESDGSGFKVPTPYIEKIGALEIQFQLIRKSNGKPIIPPQTYRSYYLRKWGGDSDTSHAIVKIKQSIIEKFPSEKSQFDFLISEIDDIELAFLDPDEFLARGGNLKQHDGVADTALEIKYRLTKQIVDQYIKQISQFNVEVSLDVASGDPVAVNLINGNAYEAAINRLESLPERSEDDSYNLGLAYESIGNRNQAVKYYQEALEQDPGNKVYSAAIKRNS